MANKKASSPEKTSSWDPATFDEQFQNSSQFDQSSSWISPSKTKKATRVQDLAFNLDSSAHSVEPNEGSHSDTWPFESSPCRMFGGKNTRATKPSSNTTRQSDNDEGDLTNEELFKSDFADNPTQFVVSDDEQQQELTKMKSQSAPSSKRNYPKSAAERYGRRSTSQENNQDEEDDDEETSIEDNEATDDDDEGVSEYDTDSFAGDSKSGDDSIAVAQTITSTVAATTGRQRSVPIEPNEKPEATTSSKSPRRISKSKSERKMSKSGSSLSGGSSHDKSRKLRPKRVSSRKQSNSLGASSFHGGPTLEKQRSRRVINRAKSSDGMEGMASVSHARKGRKRNDDLSTSAHTTSGSFGKASGSSNRSVSARRPARAGGLDKRGQLTRAMSTTNVRRPEEYGGMPTGGDYTASQEASTRVTEHNQRRMSRTASDRSMNSRERERKNRDREAALAAEDASGAESEAAKQPRPRLRRRTSTQKLGRNGSSRSLIDEDIRMSRSGSTRSLMNNAGKAPERRMSRSGSKRGNISSGEKRMSRGSSNRSLISADAEFPSRQEERRLTRKESKRAMGRSGSNRSLVSPEKTDRRVGRSTSSPNKSKKSQSTEQIQQTQQQQQNLVDETASESESVAVAHPPSPTKGRSKRKSRSSGEPKRDILLLLREGKQIQAADLMEKENRRLLHFLMYEHKMGISQKELGRRIRDERDSS